MKIVTSNPFQQPTVVLAIASVYQQSFGGEPWNEGFLCPLCERVYALVPHITFCPVCAETSQKINIVEYWPTSKVISDFYNEMKKEGSVCVVAELQKEIIGFAWGYTVSASADLDRHVDAPNVHKQLQGNYFYLDECALVPEQQGKGIGTILTKYIFREQKVGKVLLRTMNDSRMCNLIKHAGGEVVQHISKGRVIMQVLIP